MIIWKLSVGKEKRRFKSSQAAKTAGYVKPLSEIAVQHKDRKTAIIVTYKTAAYSQREIGECSHLYQQRLGLWFARTRILDPYLALFALINSIHKETKHLTLASPRTF
ncbi:hypothetical protein SAMN05421882_101126 [Nitrosomonas communis]|uniref:Uncharacterized protein n=1 Tax=Nitrosomonas communis TaxID=44574 RepID=A0A1H2TI51_9PROT|nr:hypothetical protein SAMN05421882_101126 [Nitrosomonas communis]